MSAEQSAGAVPVGVLGRPRMHLRCTDSTNERARALAIAGAPHGTLVTASEQTAGRGRQGRSWVAPAGSALLCSLLLREPPELLSLIAGVAVCDAVERGAQVKWPNDVVVERRAGDSPSIAPSVPRGATVSQAGPASRGGLAKLAGILVEGRPQEGWAVLGIGLNVAVRIEDLPEELRAGAASLDLPSSAIEPITARVLGALERRLGEPAQSVLEAWRERDALRGRGVSWSRGAGVAQGIDGSGRLIVALADGSTATLDSGEVHLARAG